MISHVEVDAASLHDKDAIILVADAEEMRAGRDHTRLHESAQLKEEGLLKVTQHPARQQINRSHSHDILLSQRRLSHCHGYRTFVGTDSHV